MIRRIKMIVLLLLCITCFVGCSQDPESITNEDLDEAFNKYYMELEQDALDLFEVIGRDRTCQYFKERILKNALYTNDNPNSVTIAAESASYDIEQYKLVYDKYYTEPNAELDKLVQLNQELDFYIQCQSDIFHKYPFNFYQCVLDIQSRRMYVTNRIESSNDDLWGVLQKTFGYHTEEGSYWSANSVLYDAFLGNYPGDDLFILYSNELNPFSNAGVYDICYYADGTMLTGQDSAGFQKEVPVLYMVDANDYSVFIEASSEMDYLLKEINNVYDSSVNLDNDTTETVKTEVINNSITDFDYLGVWQDCYSERCVIEIDKINDTYYYILIEWPNSATESTQWVCDAEYNETNNTLEYTCDCYNMVYNDDGSALETPIYEGGKGILYIGADDNLYWEDYTENVGANCVFTKLQQ